MFDHWLKPVTPISTIHDYSWGKQLSYYQGGSTSLAPHQCVLIGLDANAADAVRAELYPMSAAFNGNAFTDLGNLRKTSNDFVIPLLREVLESRLFPILIGGKPSLAYAQFQSFLGLRDLVSMVAIDERIPFSLDRKKNPNHYLNPIIHQRRESLFHLGLIGAQAHLTDPAILNWLDEQYFEYYRLGKTREQPEEVEPLLRNADIISFHLNVLKQSEAPGQLNASPSGLFLEEACQLARYAGMSDKLRSFGIYGFDSTAKRKLTATAQAVAQIIWYFTEGFYQRFGDYPVSNKGLTEYIVDWKGNNEKLTFWKSPQSGRWWLQVPVKTGHKHQRHRLIPCSYNDYQQAIEQELPDRLWNAFRRF
jgi:formiminoglutamase